MSIKRFVQFLGVGLVSAFVLVGCGGGGGATATPTVGVDGEQLAFDTTEITVPSGQQITVTFNNNSSTQQHDWVLVNGGDDVASSVDAAAVGQGGDPTGIPEVIAASAILDAGGSEQVQFQAPPSGEYAYICTVPGHYAAGMKGTLTVE
jgi:plastocyanin